MLPQDGVTSISFARFHHAGTSTCMFGPTSGSSKGQHVEVPSAPLSAFLSHNIRHRLVTPAILPTSPLAPAFCVRLDPLSLRLSRLAPRFFFQSRLVRSPIFLIPTFCGTSRRKLYMDFQSSYLQPSYNVWHSALQSETTKGGLHVRRSILVVSTKAF